MVDLASPQVRDQGDFFPAVGSVWQSQGIGISSSEMFRVSYEPPSVNDNLSVTSGAFFSKSCTT